MLGEWRLPWPTTTTNHAYAGVGSGRLRKTANAASWQFGAMAIVRTARVAVPKQTRLMMTVWQHPPKGWHGDTDGMHKLIQDAVCQGLGINDYWISEIHMYREQPVDEPCVLVRLGLTTVRSERTPAS